jgi:hypothetical protein
MAHVVADRVRETTATTGTGSLTLAGAVTGFRAFSDVCANNDTVWYCAEIQGGSEWEVGLGTWATGGILARTSVLASSNGGAAVNFSGGTKQVFLTEPASVLDTMLRSDTSKNLTKGFTGSSYAINGGSAVTTGTTTPDPANGNLQHMTNGGASTFAAPTASNEYTMVVEVTNNGSAGTLTISGFDKQSGDSLTTTSGHVFLLYIVKHKNTKHLNVVAMQ